MTSPQENYSYEDLVKYLGVAQQAQRNFRARYPKLKIELWQSEALVIAELERLLNQLRAELHEKNAYLDPDEIDGIAVGSVSAKTNKSLVENAQRHVKQETEKFRKQLEDFVLGHSLHIKTPLLRLSHLTAQFTAGRKAEGIRIDKWVADQRRYYELYHVKCVKRLGDVRELEPLFGSSIPPTSGVYFIFKEGRIVYIGSSQNLNTRLKRHEIVQTYHCKNFNDEVDCVYIELDIGKARALERKLIRVVAPVYNKKGKEK